LSVPRPSRRVMRSLCGEVGPGDGLDPRLERPESLSGRVGRKAKQLCAQAAEALAYAIAASSDDALAGLIIASVQPGPDTSRLIVTVSPPEGEHPDPSALLASLDRAAPRLRAEVATAITRRKAPSLSFRISLR